MPKQPSTVVAKPGSSVVQTTGPGSSITSKPTSGGPAPSRISQPGSVVTQVGPIAGRSVVDRDELSTYLAIVATIINLIAITILVMGYTESL